MTQTIETRADFERLLAQSHGKPILLCLHDTSVNRFTPYELEKLSRTYRHTDVALFEEPGQHTDEASALLKGYAEISERPTFLLLKDGKIVAQATEKELHRLEPANITRWVNKQLRTDEPYEKNTATSLVSYLRETDYGKKGIFKNPNSSEPVFVQGTPVHGNSLTFSTAQLRSAALYGAEIRRFVTRDEIDIDTFKDVQRIAHTYGKQGGRVTDEQLGAYFLGQMLARRVHLSLAGDEVSSYLSPSIGTIRPDALAFEYGRQIYSQNYPSLARDLPTAADAERLQKTAYQLETLVRGEGIGLFNCDPEWDSGCGEIDKNERAPVQPISLAKPVLPEPLRKGALNAATRIDKLLKVVKMMPAEKITDLAHIARFDGNAALSQEELASYLAAMGIVNASHDHPGATTVNVSPKLTVTSFPETVTMAQTVFNANFKKDAARTK